MAAHSSALAPAGSGPAVVVVGAGVVGAACAWMLARSGCRVTVVADPARSTTAVSGGHLLLQSKRPGPVLELAGRSLELTAAFAAGREAALGFRRTGSLVLAASPEEAAALQAHCRTLRAAGAPVEWLDGDTARELEPGLSPRVLGATYCPSDAQVRPAGLAAAWLEEARRLGAEDETGTLVDGLLWRGDRVTGVSSGDRDFPSDAVVLAAGPWSGEVARLAGLELGLRPRRGVLLRAIAAAPLAGRPLLGAEYLTVKFGDDPCGVAFSFQQHPGLPGEGMTSECVLGGSRELTGFETDVPPELAERIRCCGARYLPGLADLEWTSHTVGFRAWTPSGEPWIGPSPVPGLYLACGHEGDGVTLAAATAERIATTIRSS